MLRLRRALGFLCLLVLPAACMRTAVTDQRYRVAIPQDAARARVLGTCLEACASLHDAPGDAYGACVLECPGTQVTAEAPCDPTEPPDRVWCYRRIEARRVADPRGRAVLGQIVVGLFEAVLDSAFDSDDEETKTATAVTTRPGKKKRTRPAPRRVRAKPRRSQRRRSPRNGSTW